MTLDTRVDEVAISISDDGSVRVWRGYDRDRFNGNKLELVTAWQALSGMLPSTRGKIKKS